MDKVWATWKLGGTAEQAARWIGISAEVYRQQWPDQLHPVMADRVLAAILRHEHAMALGVNARNYFTDPRNDVQLQEMLQRVSIAALMAHDFKRVPALFASREGPSPDEQLMDLGPSTSAHKRKRDDTEGSEQAAPAVG